MKKKVLVTGASGFIGSNLLKELVKKNYLVYGLVRDSQKIDNQYKEKIKFLIADISQKKDLKKVFEDFDYIINTAAILPHHKLSKKDYWSTNVEGLKNLLELAQANNVKHFIQISTVGVFGQSDHIISEKSPINLSDDYSQTKATADDYLIDYGKKNNLNFTIIRPTIAYGPNDLRPGFFNLFKLIKQDLFLPIGSGNNYFHTVYVENLCHFLVEILGDKRSYEQDFIIGDDPCPKMKEVIKNIYSIEGVKMPKFGLPFFVAVFLGFFFDLLGRLNLPAPLNSRRVKFITQNRQYDLSKAKKFLGYQPTYTLKEGIAKTYNWYQDKGLI